MNLSKQEEINPYEAPLTEPGALGARSSEDESIRRHYLKHETATKSVATLYLASGLLMVLLGAVVLYVGAAQGFDLIRTGLGVLLVLLGAGQLRVSGAIRRLEPAVRIPVAVLCGIEMFAFPVGTIISAYILYLFFSEKGKIVFSEEYRQVIARTPHIQSRTSRIVIFALVMLLLVIGLIMILAITR